MIHEGSGDSADKIGHGDYTKEFLPLPDFGPGSTFDARHLNYSAGGRVPNDVNMGF